MIHPYLKPDYLAALSGGRAPVTVAPWSSAVLSRPILAGGEDAMGPYPLAPLARTADLAGGLAALAQTGLVSVVLVPDPLASPDPAQLAEAFAVCRRFKTHHLVDGPYEPSRHHRERIRRGHRRCRIETTRLGPHLADWRDLYAELAEKRSIAGAAAFSPAYFEALAAEPALVAFAAFVDDALCAMTLWFEHDGVAYNHLTAANGVGYANGASFALYDAAITHFAGACINLGGNAGVRDEMDGLAQFKAGFANTTTTAYLCGAVLDAERYALLSAGKPDGDYFPAYRAA